MYVIHADCSQPLPSLRFPLSPSTFLVPTNTFLTYLSVCNQGCLSDHAFGTVRLSLAGSTVDAKLKTMVSSLSLFSGITPTPTTPHGKKVEDQLSHSHVLRPSPLPPLPPLAVVRAGLVS